MHACLHACYTTSFGRNGEEWLCARDSCKIVPVVTGNVECMYKLHTSRNLIHEYSVFIYVSVCVSVCPCLCTCVSVCLRVHVTKIKYVQCEYNFYYTIKREYYENANLNPREMVNFRKYAKMYTRENIYVHSMTFCRSHNVRIQT